ncbi:MAG: hypothetical protein WC889_05010 [Myxococcota bacterium]
MKRRKVDKEKIERADRESRLVLDAEKQAREAKTARLRQARLAKGSSADPDGQSHGIGLQLAAK